MWDNDDHVGDNVVDLDDFESRLGGENHVELPKVTNKGN